MCIDNEIDYTCVQNRIESFFASHKLAHSIDEYDVVEIKTSNLSSSADLLENYKTFAQSMASVRMCKNCIIEKDTIVSIVSLANLCPSTCNIQPCKVYYSTKTKIQEQLKGLCGDRRVSREVPNFFVVTVDKSQFAISEYFKHG